MQTAAKLRGVLPVVVDADVWEDVGEALDDILIPDAEIWCVHPKPLLAVSTAVSCLSLEPHGVFSSNSAATVARAASTFCWPLHVLRVQLSLATSSIQQYNQSHADASAYPRLLNPAKHA